MVVVNITVAASPALINSKIAFCIPICFQIMYLVGIIVTCFQMRKIVNLAVQGGTLENGYMEHIKEHLRIITPFVILTATFKTLLLSIRVLWSSQLVDTSSPTLVWLKLTCYLSFCITPVMYIIFHKVIFIRFLSTIGNGANQVRDIDGNN